MTRDGNSCLGHSMKGLLAICALLAMAAGACADEGDGIQPFSKTQRTVLKEVKTWEIRVVESFGSAPGFAGVTAESECRALFKEAGMTVVPTGKGPSDARLHVSVSGRALSAYYHATPSQRYSGAEVKVDGWVEVSGKTLLKFRQSSYSTSTPYSISGGYTEPKEAPFPRAYASCRHTLFSQLLMLVHATNGVEPVLAVMKMKKDHEYREAGLCCFAVVKDRAAVPTLCDMLLESAENVWQVANTLGQIGDRRAIEPLTHALILGRGGIAVPNALGKIGSAEAVPALAKALVLTDIAAVRKASAEALARLGWRPTTPKHKLFLSLAFVQDVSRADTVLKPTAEAVPVLIEALGHGDGELRGVCARLLGKTGDPRGVEPLCKALATSDCRVTRYGAAVGLGTLKSPQAVPALGKVFLTDENNGVRAAAAASLGSIGGAPAAKAICQGLGISDSRAHLTARHLDSEVRLAAVEALGKIGEADSLPYLAQRLEIDSFARIRIVAAEGLRNVGGRDAVPLLCKALDDDESAVRTAVVKQLIAAEDPRATPFLRARLGKEKNEAVRKLILTAIARAKVQPEELPFGDRLRMLAHARKWKEIKAYLSTQPTERLIEALGIPEPLVKDTAQYLLIMRTGKAALGSDQAAWKKWWEAEGKKQAPQAPRPKERNRAEPIREKTTDYMDDEPDE